MEPRRFLSLLLAPPPWIAAGAIAVLAVLTFVPIQFMHPVRVKRLRVFNIALLAAWAALALVAIVQDLDPDPYVFWPLAAIAVYFFVVGSVAPAG